MATEAQIKANQLNAQKSTGPKTDEGKAAVSQNAVKHGLFAVKTVIKGENPAEYELLRTEMLAELAPSGMLESVLAERIVSLSWRLQRAERMHNEAIDVMLTRNETNAPDKDMRQDAGGAQDLLTGGLEMPLGRAAYDDFSNSRVLERLWIYERRIEYSLISTINKLQNYQCIREIREDEARKAKPARSLLRPYAEPHHIFTKGLTQYLREKFAGVSRPAEKQADLKKQTQFAPAETGAKSSIKDDYDNIPAGRVEENKADKSQLHEPIPQKGAGKRKKLPISANFLTG